FVMMGGSVPIALVEPTRQARGLERRLQVPGKIQKVLPEQVQRANGVPEAMPVVVRVSARRGVVGDDAGFGVLRLSQVAYPALALLIAGSLLVHGVANPGDIGRAHQVDADRVVLPKPAALGIPQRLAPTKQPVAKAVEKRVPPTGLLPGSPRVGRRRDHCTAGEAADAAQKLSAVDHRLVLYAPCDA